MKQTMEGTAGEWVFALGFVGMIVFGIGHFLAVLLSYVEPLGVTFWLTMFALLLLNVGALIE